MKSLTEPLPSLAESSRRRGRAPACKLCGGALQWRFALALREGLRGEYLECRTCRMLQSSHLDGHTSEQLARLYAAPDVKELDSGAAWRQWAVASRTLELARLACLSDRPGRPTRHLDFGGGSGFLAGVTATKLGWNSTTYEPYGAPCYATERCVVSWPEVAERGPYEVITATEVLEHMLDPLEALHRLRSVLAPDFAALYVTTGRYVPGLHDSSWSYLAPQSGQHVCFWAEETIRFAAQLLGMNQVMCVGAPYEWLLVRSSNRFARVRRRLMGGALQLGTTLRLLNRIE
jgi:hypothetical protein